MADRPSYPDSTGSRWGAAPPNRRNDGDRPPFLDRTEPISSAEVPQGTSSGGLDPRDRGANSPLMGGNPQRSRIDSSDPNASWHVERDQIGNDPAFGDPELAAVTGMDSQRNPDPGMYRQAPAAPVSAPPPGQHSSPDQYSAPPLQNPAPPVSGPPRGHQQGFDEPTQLHNPIQSQSQPEPAQYSEPFDRPAERRTYPEQVSDGVYRRSRPSLKIMVMVIALAIAALVGYMLFGALTGPKEMRVSAIISGVFALAGLPLTAAGITPLLGTGSNSGPDSFVALLRAPYIYLVTGLVLLIAAGLAA